MGLWQRIKRTVKKWFSGGSSSSSSSSRSSGRSGGGSSSYVSRRDGGYGSSSARYGSDRRAEQEERKRLKKRLQVYKAPTEKLKTVISTAPKTDIKKEKIAENRAKLIADRKAFNEATRTQSFSKALKTGTEKQKLALEAQKKRQARLKEWHEVTGNRFNVKEKGISAEERQRRRQNVKSQTNDEKTAVAEAKYQMKYHRGAESFARGALSGVTFGASDLAAKKLTKGEFKKAEEVYQKNKSKGAETVGEIAGSLASFGLTSGASKAVVKKALPKAVKGTIEKGGAKLTAKLAGNKLIQKAAQKEVANAVKKGLAKEVSKEAVERVAKAKAKELVGNLAENAAVDVTTGALYDVNRASKDNKVFSKKWWGEMGKSAATNAAVGTVATVGLPAAGKAVKRSFGGVTEGAEKALKNLTNENLAKRALARKAGLTSLDVPAVRTKETVKNVTDVDISNSLSETEMNTLRSYRNNLEKARAKAEAGSEEAKALSRKIRNINRVLNRIDKTVDNVKGEETIVKQAKRVADDVSDNVIDNMSALRNEREEILERLGKAKEGKEALSTDETIALGTRLDNIETELGMRNQDGTIKKSTNESAPKEAQLSLEEAVGSAEKKTPPKTKAQKAKAHEAEKIELDELARRQREGIDRDVRSATKGEYGYRQGEATAAQYGSKTESKRIVKSQNNIKNALERDGAFKSDEFGIFKTANKAKRDEIASNAYNRVSKDPQAVLDRLRKVDTRLRLELKSKSALESAEHISIDDIADVTALRNLYEESGSTVPEEYEKIFSNIIAWQKTENAQGLVATDLFLKENSPEYRRTLLQRDLNNFMRKVIGADDAEIADIKRSLDANFGEGYFDNALKELSNTKRKWGEAEFREAYKELQAQIFMNSKPSVWDTVNLFRHSFMLSSLKTGANNIIGNVMMRTMYNVADLMQVGVETAMQKSGADFRRTTALLHSKDQKRLAKMFTSGSLGEHNIKNAKYLEGFDDQVFANFINEWARIDVAEMMESSKYMGDIVKGINYKPTTAGGSIKQGAVKLGGIGNKAVSYMLNEPDSWFVERNYRSALLKYLEANGVRDAGSFEEVGESLLKDARAHAKDVALENTYKKANRVVSFLEGIRQKGYKKGSSVPNKVATLALDAELPYLKVPANLVVNNFKYSPLGVFKGGVDAAIAIARGDTNALNVATKEMSKGLTGTGMFILGYMMFCEDQSDDNSLGFIGDAKDELKEYGVRDNSFKIGNHNFSLANMGIGSVQFLMGAALAEDFQEAGKVPAYQAVLDAAGKTLDVTADMSLLENATAIMDAFGNGGDYNMTMSDRFGNAGQKIAGDYAAQFIPNPLRGVAKGMTSADLDTGVKKGDTTKAQRNIERSANNFIQGVPVLNEKLLAHKVDTHGNLVNERKTAGDKAKQVAINVLDPFSTRKVHVPEADKEELKVSKINRKTGEETDKKYKPRAFDEDRTFKAAIGKGDFKQEIDLTRKEREQAARSVKKSGKDMASALIYATRGWFGDSHGERAQQILAEIPEDEEKAREYLYSTPEFQSLSNKEKNDFLDTLYKGGTNINTGGRNRTANKEVYVNIKGGDEGDFKFLNDLHWKTQAKYADLNLETQGISKGQWANAIEAIKWENHKYKEETGENQDSYYSAKKVKNALLGLEDLDADQRIAIYNAIRGKRTSFGWYDWDGVSGGYSGRRGYRRRGYRRRGGGGRSSKPVEIKTSAYKPKAADLKVNEVISTTDEIRTAIPKKKSSTKKTPPTPKFKKYEV